MNLIIYIPVAAVLPGFPADRLQNCVCPPDKRFLLAPMPAQNLE